MAFSLRVRVRDLCDVVLIVFPSRVVPSQERFNEPLLIKRLILDASYSLFLVGFDEERVTPAPVGDLGRPAGLVPILREERVRIVPGFHWIGDRSRRGRDTAESPVMSHREEEPVAFGGGVFHGGGKFVASQSSTTFGPPPLNQNDGIWKLSGSTGCRPSDGVREYLHDFPSHQD